MRKALIGILLAASAATPAFAQESEQQQRWQQRFEQRQQQNQARSDQRQQRQEQRGSRQERVEQRQERVEQRQQSGQQSQGGGFRQERHVERDQQGQQFPDGWNNVDPNDRRAVRARDRYLAQERRNSIESDRREDRREWREDQRRWDRQRWRNDRRYDWYGYRNNYRDVYRMGRYYDPYGYDYGYRRFRVGIQIGQPFYSGRYRINDPWRYRLPHAGPGYTWVRYYNDVVLVDTWSGQVVDVIYDFFW